MNPHDDDPIEQYLDEFLISAIGTPRQVRHTLAEIENHLQDAATDGEQRGLTRAQARVSAVTRLGPVGTVVDRTLLGVPLSRALMRRSVLTALLVAGVGGLCAGLAAVLIVIARSAWGAQAVATTFPTGAYTTADCARWLAGHPATTTCLQAQLDDHAFDVVRNLVAVALVGALCLIGRWALTRRWGTTGFNWRSPLDDLVGFFGAATVSAVAAAQAFNAVTVTRSQGAWTPASIATTAAIGATYFVVRNWRLSRPHRKPAAA